MVMKSTRSATRTRRTLPASPDAAQRADSNIARDPEPARHVSVLGAGRKIIVSGSRDARVAAIAGQQRGRVARRQLLAAGLRPGQIHHLTRTDRLFIQLCGVYAVGSPAPVALGRETTALLAVRPGALLSHTSAARLWGLIPETDDEGPVHVTVDGGWIPQIRGVHGHHSRILSVDDRRIRERLPVCSAARVLLDLAAELDDRRLERAYDDGQISGVVRPRDIAEVLQRAGRHPGVCRLRELADADADAAGVTRSEAEKRLREIVRGAELPAPRVNARLHGYELDFLWPAANLVVEVDGYRVHSTRAAFERDRLRDARLQALGVEVLRVTWRQLEREPLAVVARIAAALARRTATPR
jgi:very-short-patch-repair endonuclease